MDSPVLDALPAEDLLARADAERDRRAWADAAELYAAFLRREPGRWDIWVQYGHCTKECGDPETALLLYREAEALRPEEADTHLHLGHALKLLGRKEEAREAYARALGLDPANAHARQELVAMAEPAVEAAPDGAAAACVFDASDLLDYVRHNRMPTGIQRVQLNLIEHSLGRGPAGAVVAAGFDGRSGAWKAVPRDVFSALAALARSGAALTDPDWTDAVAAASDAVRHGPPLRFAPGGVLVTLGTAWWIPDYLLRVREAKARHGVRYVPLIYDCIPALLPEHCAAGLSAEFAAWFAGACAHADAMLAISDRSCEDALRLRRRVLPRAEDIPVTVLPLHAGPLLPESRGAPAPDGRPRRRPYVLFVATVESRKNHVLVFNAWLTLIRRHGAEAVPDLVCVGKRGWLADAVFALLSGSAALRERVSMLHDVPDTELDALYRNCLCTVFNSHYEGWGLPVTESIGYGKVPVVADNSALRQAGGEAALFFATGSEPELVARLEAMFFDAEFRAEREACLRASPPLRRWDELAADLAAALDAVPRAASPPLARLGPLRAGAEYETRALPGPEPVPEMAIADAVREGPCWGRREEWGVRTLRGSAVLRLPAAIEGTARITLQMRGPPGGARFGLRAGTADAAEGPFRWIEAADDERLFCVLEVPDAAGRELVVEIETPQGARLDDGRMAGPGLLGFMVCAADDFAARLGYLERKALAKLVVV